MLASPSVREQVLATTDQDLTSLGDVAARIAGTLVSIRGKTTQAAPPTSAAVSVGGPRKQKGTAEKKRAGGWQPSPRLSWQQVKEIDAAVHRLAGPGVAPTHCITIMPPASITADNQRKRFCVGKIAHIGEALKRHDKPHIGLTTFENPLDAHLHANHLAHVPRCERETIKRFHNPPTVHVETIYDLPGVVAYVTKERRQGPAEGHGRARARAFRSASGRRQRHPPGGWGRTEIRGSTPCIRTPISHPCSGHRDAEPRRSGAGIHAGHRR